MSIILVSIHVLAAFILVVTVLLQAGKGAGMGAAFGGSSGTVFGARGPATLISKITCVAAVVFMCTSLNMAISQSGAIKKGSVMDEWQESPPMASPAATPAPAAAPASPVTPAPTTDATAPAPAAEANTSAAPAAESPEKAPADQGSAPAAQ